MERSTAPLESTVDFHTAVTVGSIPNRVPVAAIMPCSPVSSFLAVTPEPPYTPPPAPNREIELLLAVVTFTAALPPTVVKVTVRAPTVPPVDRIWSWVKSPAGLVAIGPQSTSIPGSNCRNCTSVEAAARLVGVVLAVACTSTIDPFEVPNGWRFMSRFRSWTNRVVSERIARSNDPRSVAIARMIGPEIASRP